jgi:hypothetical protein
LAVVLPGFLRYSLRASRFEVIESVLCALGSLHAPQLSLPLKKVKVTEIFVSHRSGVPGMWRAPEGEGENAGAPPWRGRGMGST